MKLKAYPKINLCLDVISKRQDGYHDLNFVFCLCDIFRMRTPLYDIIDLEISDKPGIRLFIPGSDLTNGPDNLVWKAVQLMLEDGGLQTGIDITLYKRIPSGAGLGGGSSDAAAVMKALNKLLRLELTDDELIKNASLIGADVPFFIKGGTAHVTGTGEKIKAIRNMKNSALMILKPKVSISTAEAYKAVDDAFCCEHPDTDLVVSAIEADDYDTVFRNVGNSFEEVIFKTHPQIRELKNEILLTGADCSVMTGSGSALYALFDSTEKSCKAADALLNNKDIADLIGGIYV